MSSGNKLKVADQKFIFCQVCFYFRPFSLFQRNMKNKMNLCSRSTGVQRSKNQVLPIIICFRLEKRSDRTNRKVKNFSEYFVCFRFDGRPVEGPGPAGDRHWSDEPPSGFSKEQAVTTAETGTAPSRPQPVEPRSLPIL